MQISIHISVDEKMVPRMHLQSALNSKYLITDVYIWREHKKLVRKSGRKQRNWRGRKGGWNYNVNTAI